jgi:hypothetical protein
MAGQHEYDERSIPDPPEAGELKSFPFLDLSKGQEVWRVHKSHQKPWHFDNGGRFGLAPPDGTCYVAKSDITAICETVIRGRVAISEDDLSGRIIRRMVLPKPFRLADCCRSEAIGFRVTRRLLTEFPYEQCPRWARAFRRDGFLGISYWPTYDPGDGRRTYALFGAASTRESRDWRIGRGAQLTGAKWRAKITDELRVLILPPDSDADLDYVSLPA